MPAAKVESDIKIGAEGIRESKGHHCDQFRWPKAKEVTEAEAISEGAQEFASPTHINVR